MRGIFSHLDNIRRVKFPPPRYSRQEHFSTTRADLEPRAFPSSKRGPARQIVCLHGSYQWSSYSAALCDGVQSRLRRGRMPAKQCTPCLQDG
jgi:hypothetical protein